jgi:hypothetical protein
MSGLAVRAIFGFVVAFVVSVALLTAVLKHTVRSETNLSRDEVALHTRQDVAGLLIVLSITNCLLAAILAVLVAK